MATSPSSTCPAARASRSSSWRPAPTSTPDRAAAVVGAGRLPGDVGRGAAGRSAHRDRPRPDAAGRACGGRRGRRSRRASTSTRRSRSRRRCADASAILADGGGGRRARRCGAGHVPGWRAADGAGRHRRRRDREPLGGLRGVRRARPGALAPEPGRLLRAGRRPAPRRRAVLRHGPRRPAGAGRRVAAAASGVGSERRIGSGPQAGEPIVSAVPTSVVGTLRVRVGRGRERDRVVRRRRDRGAVHRGARDDRFADPRRPELVRRVRPPSAAGHRGWRRRPAPVRRVGRAAGSGSPT